MPLTNQHSGNAKSPKSQRPKLAIPRTRLEINCEVVAVAVLVLLFIYLVATWTTLPGQDSDPFQFFRYTGFLGEQAFASAAAGPNSGSLCGNVDSAALSAHVQLSVRDHRSEP